MDVSGEWSDERPPLLSAAPLRTVWEESGTSRPQGLHHFSPLLSHFQHRFLPSALFCFKSWSLMIWWLARRCGAFLCPSWLLDLSASCKQQASARLKVGEQIKCKASIWGAFLLLGERVREMFRSYKKVKLRLCLFGKMVAPCGASQGWLLISAEENEEVCMNILCAVVVTGFISTYLAQPDPRFFKPTRIREKVCAFLE